MANVTLPAIPALAAGALFVKGIANGGMAATAAQYVTYGHCFQIGQLSSGSGLAANFGSGSVPCQVDVKTSYADGSVAHALVTVQVPSLPAGTTTWGQFSAAAAPSGAALSLASALGSTTLSLALTPTALPGWQAGQSVAGGAVIKPSTGNAGGYCFQADSPSATAGTTGTAEPVWPQTIGGTVTDGTVTWINVSNGLPTLPVQDLIALAKSAAFDPWLNGPLAVQGRARATLYQGLRLVVDITAYADGSVGADVMLANDIAMLSAAGTLCYTATLTMNGAAAYTSPALVHYQYQNWTAQVGTVPGGVRVVHDPNEFIAAQAVQPYTTVLGVDPSRFSSAQAIVSASGFGQPLTNPGGVVSTVMGGEGGRTDVGPNDSWSVWWFITQDPTFEAVAVEAAKVNGAIPWHFWNAGSADYYKVTDTVGPNNTVGFWPAEQTDSWTVPLTQPVPWAAGWQIDNAHFPELAYIVYLTKGRRYYLDELNATTWGMLCWIWPFDRSARLNSALWNEYCGTEGYCLPGSQTRVGAWTLRNILCSDYASPDGSAAKAYARQMLDSNYAWLNEQTAAWTTYEGQPYGYIPINLCCVYGDGDNMPPWQNDYLSSSVALAATMGYEPASQFAAWMANFIIGRFATDIPGWYPADGIAYNWALTSGGGAPQTWAAEETLLQGYGSSQVTVENGVPVNTWQHQSGDYGQLALNSLVGAQVIGLSGAAAAYQWLAGIGSPFTDPASWAVGPLVQMLPRGQNASQVFATPRATNDVNGAVLLAPPAASGTLVAGADVLSGAAKLGPVVAAGTANMPTYAELAAFLASAMSDLNAVVAALQQWEATLAADATSAPPAAAAVYQRWHGTIAAEVTSIEQALASLP